MATAFSPRLINSVVTGTMSRSTWTAEIGEAVGNLAAAKEWLSASGHVNWDLIEITDGLRRRGKTVAILTNGTDTIPAEMIDLGVTDRFDRIFNTAEIGFAKPDRRAFAHVCEQLNVPSAEVFFTDDSESKLAGAIELGMTARRFEGNELFQQHLDEFVR